MKRYCLHFYKFLVAIPKVIVFAISLFILLVHMMSNNIYKMYTLIKIIARESDRYTGKGKYS
jgi:hypothetical protein